MQTTFHQRERLPSLHACQGNFLGFLGILARKQAAEKPQTPARLLSICSFEHKLIAKFRMSLRQTNPVLADLAALTGRSLFLQAEKDGLMPLIYDRLM